ncbi:hypothetical protein V6N13_053483 [Hibiscus sabdariffa]
MVRLLMFWWLVGGITWLLLLASIVGKVLSPGDGAMTCLPVSRNSLWWPFECGSWVLLCEAPSYGGVVRRRLGLTLAASTISAPARLLGCRAMPDPMYCLVCHGGVRCLPRNMAARCRAAAWCRADCHREYLLFLLLKYSSFLACKPSVCALACLPVLHDRAARRLWVWHCYHGPASLLVDSRSFNGRCLLRLLPWLPGPTSLLAIYLCSMLPFSLAYKFSSSGRTLELLFKFE